MGDRYRRKNGEFAKKPGRKPKTAKQAEMYGEGFRDGVKALVGKLKKAHDYVKENQLISRGAKALVPFTGKYGEYFQSIGDVAEKHGYGRRKTPKRVTGGGRAVVVLTRR